MANLSEILLLPNFCNQTIQVADRVRGDEYHQLSTAATLIMARAKIPSIYTFCDGMPGFWGGVVSLLIFLPPGYNISYIHP
jgi:hypothetical protein